MFHYVTLSITLPQDRSMKLVKKAIEGLAELIDSVYMFPQLQLVIII